MLGPDDSSYRGLTLPDYDVPGHTETDPVVKESVVKPLGDGYASGRCSLDIRDICGEPLTGVPAAEARVVAHPSGRWDVYSCVLMSMLTCSRNPRSLGFMDRESSSSSPVSGANSNYDASRPSTAKSCMSTCSSRSSLVVSDYAYPRRLHCTIGERLVGRSIIHSKTFVRSV